jgi:alpha,alpha-trehalase
MVDKYGFMPNGNCDWYLNRSQAPFLAMMVYDVYQMTQDKVWLNKAFPVLEKEYQFWMEKRATANSLNRYFHHADEAGLDFFYEDVVVKRVAFFRENPPTTPAEKRKVAADYLAEAESGWDFNPRFDHRCGDFVPVDLNGYLFFYEQIMAHICDELSLEGADEWLKRAARRKSNFDSCCWNSKRGLFMDYDTVNERQSTVASLATFVPLWSRLASHEQADQLVANLPLFERDFGVATCEPTTHGDIFQWDFPNGWPPLFYITIMGLTNYGYLEAGKRIAEKYLNLVGMNFEKTGDLWEKYNVSTGTIDVQNEYEMPAMMGWTAGVFVFCVNFVKHAENILKNAG